MKKLDQLFTWEHPTLEGRIEEIHKKVVPLINLVNSQQEAIEKLEKRLSFFEVYGNPSSPPPEPADNKIEYMEESQTLTKEQMEWIEERVNKDLRNTSATHRTVTLRIPKGMRIGQAIDRATVNVYQLYQVSDTDLQKALDEVQPNE